MATKKKRSARSDMKGFALGGGILLALSCAFLWAELKLDPEYLVAAIALLGTVASLIRKPRFVSFIGLVVLLSAGIGGGVWYAVVRAPSLLVGLGTVLVGALLNTLITYPAAKAANEREQIGLIWVLMTVSALVGSWSFYFHFLTQGIAAESLVRRLILTLVWVAAGTLLVVIGRMRNETAVRYSGYVFVTIAFAKALGYDTVQLSGVLRIGTLAAAGVVLMGGSLLLSRGAAEDEGEDEAEPEAAVEPKDGGK